MLYLYLLFGKESQLDNVLCVFYRQNKLKARNIKL